MKKFSFSLPFLLVPTILSANVETPPAGQSIIQTFVMIGIAVLFFYIILWRPEQKRRKAQIDQRKNLKVGDRVTAMGIVAVVDSISEHTVILRNVDGSKIEVLSGAISDIDSPTVTETEQK